MASTIVNLTTDNGPEVYYDNNFRATLDTHLEYLRKHQTTSVQQITPIDLDLYKGDFYGFLSSKGTPKYLHWIILRLNDMTSPLDFTPEMSIILIPDYQTVDLIRQQYLMIQKLT